MAWSAETPSPGATVGGGDARLARLQVGKPPGLAEPALTLVNDELSSVE